MQSPSLQAEKQACFSITGTDLGGDRSSASAPQQEADQSAPRVTAPDAISSAADLSSKAPEVVLEGKGESKPEPSTDELLLPHNSAGSAKARHGGSIYDMLVQEIKSLKLQQKQTPRQLAELQRNLSVFMEKAAAEMGALDQAVKGLQSDFDSLQRVKVNLEEESDTAVARFSDVEVDLRSVLVQLESMQRALHQVQHRVTAIVLLAIIAWLAVVVLTAPALGQLTWILWVPIFLIAAIGVVWLMPIVIRILSITT